MAELPSPNLARHEADGVFNALIAAGLESDVTVLTGSPPGVLAAERCTGLAHDLHARGARWVLVSREEKPLLADLDGRRVEVRTPAFHPVNHRGAGDSMTCATAAGMAAGLSPEEILRLAVAAAALNVTRHGLGSGDAEAIRRLADRVDVSDWPAR